MSLERILKLVPPPKTPIHASPSMSWAEVQRKLGAALPDSLDQFGRAYGSGSFDAGHAIEIYNPHDPAYFATIQTQCEVYEDLKESSPEFHPYDSVPAKDGIIPLGTGNTGVQFYFLFYPRTNTEIVIFDDHCGSYLEYDMTVFEFFYRFLCNDIEETPYFNGPIKFIPRRLYFPDEM